MDSAKVKVNQLQVPSLEAIGIILSHLFLHPLCDELSLELIEKLFFLKEKEAKILFLQKAIDVVGKTANVLLLCVAKKQR